MTELTIDGREVIFYEVSDYSTVEYYIANYYNKTCYSAVKRTREYINVACAFDIETTTTNIGTLATPDYTAFMYHWQFAFNEICFHGRYWDEFMELLELLYKSLRLHTDRRLVIYAHFAAYEFQFLRNFIHVESAFCRKVRVPIRVEFDTAFELRCSWALSNMSLAKCIDNTPGAFFKKRSGDEFDYLKLRLPSTPLTDLELQYCYCDVAGLVEYINHCLESDTIASIPMTSTGYIRRDCRKAVKENPDNDKELQSLALTPKLYCLVKTGARGGNSHGNAMFTDITLENVSSYDRKSSYPAEMIVGLYPMTQFQSIRPSNDNLLEAVATKACLLEITYYNLSYKHPWGIPYIAKAKCVHLHTHPLIDNGRIVKAEYATMVITDIDYRIIESQYYYSSIELSSLYIAEYGHLNNEFRLSLRDLFVEKCKLEKGDKYLYNKFKNKINAYFGMMLTDICSPEILYDPCPPFIDGKQKYWTKGEINIEEMLQKYYSSRNAFLSYQHGMWVTANARYQHQLGIDAVGIDIVYGDTDSVKYIENHNEDFERLNREWLAICDNNDISPSVTVDGKVTTLGIWEKEATAAQFRFLGAKKYAYIDQNGKLSITVAGLSKQKGAKWLTENGGLEAFTLDTEIPTEYSGRTVSHYIDVQQPYEITINGESFTTGSCIATVPTTYKFGVTEDYLDYYTSIR